jgi:hypothetical protein
MGMPRCPVSLRDRNMISNHFVFPSITEFFHTLTLGTILTGTGAFLTELHHLAVFSRPRRIAVTVFSHMGAYNKTINPLGQMKLTGDSVKLCWLTDRT